jgi:hypothetical protein
VSAKLAGLVRKDPDKVAGLARKDPDKVAGLARKDSDKVIRILHKGQVMSERFTGPAGLLPEAEKTAGSSRRFSGSQGPRR